MKTAKVFEEQALSYRLFWLNIQAIQLQLLIKILQYLMSILEILYSFDVSFRKSPAHSNVFAFASGKEHDYSYLSTFTDHWTRLDHSHTCTDDIFQVSWYIKDLALLVTCLKIIHHFVFSIRVISLFLSVNCQLQICSYTTGFSRLLTCSEIVCCIDHTFIMNSCFFILTMLASNS